jgi:hypothetical protein
LTERDEFFGAEVEEEVLSSMMSGKMVRSLGPEHFTTPFRRWLYVALARGVAYEELEREARAAGFGTDDIVYITDVWLVPILPHRGLVEAVEDLKRLALIRPLCRAVDQWRRGAPMMTYARAVKELGKLIRSNHRASSRGQNSSESDSPSPK